MNYLLQRWRAPNGYRALLGIAIPLILSTGSWAILHFVDRMFLTWYSPVSIAAAMPAGILNFTFMSLFIGTAGYVTTFVAQYYGAGLKKQIGPVLWQGLYLSIAGGIIIMLLIPFAEPFFRFAGHGERIAKEETIFFQWLCLGAIPAIGASALSGFYSGLGKTWPVMWINIAATIITIVGDYLLVFGNFGFPELGIKGAAIATDVAALFSFTAYIVIIFTKANEKEYAVLSQWKVQKDILFRLVRFGFPSGIQFFLDVAGFTAFIFFVGFLGEIPLAASNIAMSINPVAFMPVVGVGIAVSVLVGQRLGENNPNAASASIWSGFHITIFYMTIVASLYMFTPGLFLDPYLNTHTGADAKEIREIAVVIMRFMAVYTLFDAMNILFGSALKGAGDTRYVMIQNIVLSVVVLVIPSYILIRVLHKGIFSAWLMASIYIGLLGFGFLFRVLGGKWRSMRVIEEPGHCIAVCPPEIPVVD